ncbi:MAG: hypothetical protein DI603_21320 [Roseateles depolymerans]|uniref:Heptosyltransferase n=1 Tax=Roseateles depolymerans TaxID=76731 RepID=A0A2W5DEX9_9BURK|nr:MAG: hypothetical protein DI603_21320 [Roseateles depolymerans]
MIEARSSSRPLIVRLRNFVGDTVLSLPALRLLQSHGYQLELVGKGWARALLEAEGWHIHVRPGPLGQRVRQLRELRRQCRAQDAGFDARLNTLLLPWSFSAALDARLAGLRAMGYGYEGNGLLLSRTLRREPGRHALQDYWTLACEFLGVQLPPPAAIGLQVSEAQRVAARELLDSLGLSEGRYVLICPFASGKVEFIDRSWPAFPDFVRQLKAAGVPVLIVPGPTEVDGARALYPEALALPGVALGVYNALLQLAGVVVSNDTGPAHMAAAVGGRVISVLGPTQPEHWAPWGPGVQVMRCWPEWPTAGEVLTRVERTLASAG